ncbi:hypothetical protein GGX14DRAFT_398618 [Mycena pura]|uniref:Uncharacterized protein n=1 Tax=Mycena pura TaxID=153505 RepID=A0AAD6V689_9AGAR|nr:hypothetical protein GGX14DRAFT_398618 [Mycena pura]
MPNLSSIQSASQILFDAISNVNLQCLGWILRHAVHLQIKHFRVVRTQLHLANREGWRLAREKTEAAKQGLEAGGDLQRSLISVNSDKSNSGRLREEDTVAQISLLIFTAFRPSVAKGSAAQPWATGVGQGQDP